MPLSLVATPIGNPEDITLRAKNCLESADFIICEEPKPARATLKIIGISPQKEMYCLNEHTSAEDLKELTEKCRERHGALITDCGTPIFCDPGSRLVKRCRQAKISVQALPGASSLMTALCYCSQRIDSFYFVGFLPAKKELRRAAIQKLKSSKETLVLLDTPYRLVPFMKDIAELGVHRKALLCLDLTTDTECILEGELGHLAQNLPREKAEFVLIIYKFKTTHRRQ